MKPEKDNDLQWVLYGDRGSEALFFSSFEYGGFEVKMSRHDYPCPNRSLWGAWLPRELDEKQWNFQSYDFVDVISRVCQYIDSGINPNKAEILVKNNKDFRHWLFENQADFGQVSITYDEAMNLSFDDCQFLKAVIRSAIN